jgi:hypothetical protein
LRIGCNNRSSFIAKSLLGMLTNDAPRNKMKKNLKKKLASAIAIKLFRVIPILHP